jgi:hypothetical protein
MAHCNKFVAVHRLSKQGTYKTGNFKTGNSQGQCIRQQVLVLLSRGLQSHFLHVHRQFLRAAPLRHGCDTRFAMLNIFAPAAVPSTSGRDLAVGHKQTWRVEFAMFALPPKADIITCHNDA